MGGGSKYNTLVVYTSDLGYTQHTALWYMYTQHAEVHFDHCLTCRCMHCLKRSLMLQGSPFYSEVDTGSNPMFQVNIRGYVIAAPLKECTCALRCLLSWH